jgi:hypothetical protein
VFSARLRDDIVLFFQLANGHRKKQMVPLLGMAFDRSLAALSAGQDGIFVAWPEWAVFAFGNIRSRVRAGVYRVRLCPDCDLWIFVKKRDRIVCATCRKRRHAEVVAKANRAELQDARAALTNRRNERDRDLGRRRT